MTKQTFSEISLNVPVPWKETISQPLYEILEDTKALGIDRVRIFWLSDDGETITAVGQQGMPAEFVGSKRHLRDDRCMQALLARPEPHFFIEGESIPLKSTSRESIKAYLPLTLKGKVVGRLSLDNQPSQKLIKAVLLKHITNFANSILGAALYDRQVEALEALHRTGQNVISLDLNQILIGIGKQISNLAQIDIDVNGIGSLWLGDENEMQLVVVSPGQERHLNRRINFRKDEKAIKGVAARAVKLKRSQLIPNTRRVKHYYPLFGEYLTELAVPIKTDKRVIGLINVQHKNPHAFDYQDQLVLEALAGQASIAIQSAKLYQEMKKIKGFIGGQTAVEWIKMMSYTWGHAIRREVGTARTLLALLEQLAEVGNQEMSTICKDLEDSLVKIKNIPILAPLDEEDAMDMISLNNLLKTYLIRQWSHRGFEFIGLRMDFQPDLDSQTRVWASSNWLRRAFEIIVENAARAMKEAKVPRKELTVETRLEGKNVFVIFRDTGPGIPSNLLGKIFKEPIKKEEGARGVGIGLALARTILQTYDGDIFVNDSKDKEGAEFILSLPANIIQPTETGATA